MPGVGAPVGAHEPAPEPTRQYYGPLRICDGNFAFDVSAGEGFVQEGGYGSSPELILFPDGYLTLGGGWTWRKEQLGKDVLARSGIELPGQRLERFEINPPEGGGRFFYTYVAGPGPERRTIMSDHFDGSERDRTLLDRIVFGERAREMCASIPAGLQRVPATDVHWFTPTLNWGPVTICMAGLAFDVRPGELARLPWYRKSNYFQIASGDRRTFVSGLDERVWKRSGEPDVAGPVSRDPRFTTAELSEVPDWAAMRPGPEGRFVALWRRSDGQTHGPHGLSPVGFAFDGAATAEERQAFIQRLRTRRPDDRCLGAKPS